MAYGGPEIVVIGGGFAGAATGYFLVRRGFRRVVLLEQEAGCGVHASGRNAAMVRQVVPEEAVASLAEEGAAFLRRPPADWGDPPAFSATGSLLLASGSDWDDLQQQAEAARRRGVPAHVRTRQSIRAAFPFLADDAFDGGILCASDGIVDIAALLEGYLRGIRRGDGEVRTGVRVRHITVSEGRARAVETSAGRFPADVVVNAAGAWAGRIGRLAGAFPAPLQPRRRHLFLAGPASGVDPRWPFIWDVTHEFYLRPESGGMLLCACDEDLWPPGNVVADPAVQERLAEKFLRHAPALATLPIRSFWAGLRTLTPDGRFVIGWDPDVRGFFWVAGLGGHGVTASAAIGALAARLIDEGPSAESPPFLPRRFAAASAKYGTSFGHEDHEAHEAG